MIPDEFIKEINGYYFINKAIHPITKEIYKLGDKVIKIDDCIMYGSGKQYIETINTMFCVKNSEYIFCSEDIFKDSEFKRKHWASRPVGYYLNEIERKVSLKEFNEIQKAKQLLKKFN